MEGWQCSYNIYYLNNLTLQSPLSDFSPKPVQFEEAEKSSIQHIATGCKPSSAVNHTSMVYNIIIV